MSPNFGLQTLAILDQIGDNNANGSNNKFLFLHHHKQSRPVDSKQISSAASTSIVQPTVKAFENTILQAYSYASRHVRQSRIVDYLYLNQHDLDFHSDSDDSSGEEDEDTTENRTDNEDLTEDDENYVSDHISKVSSTTFQRMQVFDSINPTLVKSYFIVNINSTKKYLHKRTAT
ncbi:unnamed protein product [Rotaria socialis]|uniref:Uncharacterized protein n=1 Tax=Rotaria socialis TaxID=392032 RepID=A0A820HXT4_9BILA|nr:unnamed protein product [Rotaria socialis]